MRVPTILITTATLIWAVPSVATNHGHPNPHNPNIQYGGNGRLNNGCGNGNHGNTGQNCMKRRPPQYGHNNRPRPPHSGKPHKPQKPPHYGQPQRPPHAGKPHKPPQYGQPQKPPHYGKPGKPPQYGQPQRPPHYGKPGKPPQYGQRPPHYGRPPKGIPASQLPNLRLGQHNRNSNSNQNTNTNNNAAYATASATGGSAWNENSNNANLQSSVTVEGSSFIHNERHRRIPVNTAYAAPLTSGIDTCLGSASGGVQTGIVGLSLGGTRRDRICEQIKLSRELHAMGMREAAVQLLCIDPRVRSAMLYAGTPCGAVTYAPPMPAYYAPPARQRPYRRPAERG